MQAMTGDAATGFPHCLHPMAVAGVPAAASLARTSPPGGAVAAELAGAGTSLVPCGPGAGACFSAPEAAVLGGAV
jgi:hypothetical protein